MILSNVDVTCSISLSLDSHHAPINISIHDRHQLIKDVSIFGTTLFDFDFKLKFPNELKICLGGPNTYNTPVRLEKLSLGGLALSETVLDQICQYTQTGSEQMLFLRNWPSNGSVKIDFFASDWVQYHLLYRNKFDFKRVR